MTKSKMQTVRRRQTNQRFQRQYDKEKQLRVRAYDSRQKVRTKARQTTAVVNAWRRITRHVSAFFSNLSRRFFSAHTISGLDLRASDAARFGAFRPNRSRDTGAAWLRNAFGQCLKMISTRDGKRV